LGRAGFGSYHYGVSNGAEFSLGRLWAIGRIGGSGQNTGSDIVFKPIDISNDGWKPASTGTKVTDKGSWCDIHVAMNSTSRGQNSKAGHGLSFNPTISAGANGLQLSIHAHGPEVYGAGLYNLQGKQKSFIRPTSSLDHMPLGNTAGGAYVIKLNTGGGQFQKAVRIVR
jgi:hypothetical protein